MTDGNRWRRMSLRSRVTVIATVAVAGAVAVVSIATWAVLTVQLRRTVTDDLRTAADAIVASAGPAGLADLTLPSGAGRGRLVQVVLADGTTRVPAGQEGWPVTSAELDVVQGRSTEALRRADLRLTTVDSLPSEWDGPYMVFTTAGPGGAVQVARGAELYDTAPGQLGLALLLVGGAGVAAAAIAGRAVARVALAPVDRLTAAVETISRTRDLATEVEPVGGGEIGRLAAAFNDMLAALNTSRRAQRQLAEDAAHELKTPLTSLRTNVELLLRLEGPDIAGRLDPADRARLLGDLDAQTVELSHLVDELTELARADVGPADADRIDLASVVAAAIDRARVRTPEARIVADLTPADVIGRAAALERAVLNLLDNATQFSPPGEPIEVRLSIERGSGGGFAVVEVDDGGPGIDPADRPHVFSRFYRAESARGRPGSGLGLSIVERAVITHGGDITVHPSARGGALLRLRLPHLSRHQLPAEGGDSDTHHGGR